LLSLYAFLTSFIATPDARIEADNGYCILWFMLNKYNLDKNPSLRTQG